MNRLIIAIVFALLLPMAVCAQQEFGGSPHTSSPDDSKAAPAPSPEQEAQVERHNQEFTDSLTARAALVAVLQFNSKLSVYAPLASDPIACADCLPGAGVLQLPSSGRRHGLQRDELG
jgi:hypothetical protein